jgi:hypothetical protein
MYIKIHYIIMPVARCTRYNIMWKVCQWFATVLWFSTAIPGFLQHKNWPPRYNWNIVESGVEPHNPRHCIINCAYNMCFVFICSIMKNKSKPWRNIFNWNKLENNYPINFENIKMFLSDICPTLQFIYFYPICWTTRTYQR